MNNFLNGYDLAKAVISGANSLKNKKNEIDALNVFPVPDGDTGSNMASTIFSCVDNLEKLLAQNPNPSISEVAQEISHSMIYAARGNSGVILSQIFKGFSLGCQNKEKVSSLELVDVFVAAKTRAYKAVFSPVEGTILTVIREVSEGLEKNINGSESILDFFKAVVSLARKSTDETPNKLKILREVGVNDSGAEGLYLIFLGMLSYLEGFPIELSETEEKSVNNFISDLEIYDGEFGYCTELLIDLNDPENFKKEKFQNKVEKMAASLVLIQDDNLLKIHGHTEKPGSLISYCHKYGELIKIKSENMSLQAKESKKTAQSAQSNFAANKSSEEELCGLVSCNFGSGIIKKMKEYGCHNIVEGGNTQNPSASDIIAAINEVNAKNVFVLPNNSNIILAAQQAAQMIKNKNVIIIPSKTQVQGISAALNFNAELSPEDNEEMMLDSIKSVVSGSVTKAVRTTEINGIKIKENDFIAVKDGNIISSHKDDFTVIKKLIKKMVTAQHEVVSIYYGENSSFQDAQKIEAFIKSQWDIEVEIFEGNQPNYYFLIGVE
ncbi:DAK2 domain-containing protein [Mycoplasmopsis synoviae]|uniref:DhaL domain-containing protein n=1 Tax=Mycoplasmopsis synoviae (strain 53) TaxID=262723 RepID=Q4A591_MYCS5|nr:DAK2 domain-containing protein [Mycoplasmopsis synoviae]AAZ44080.1 conserved hypothetical protein [Mycoplasmopsis synoviae 53]